MDNFGVGPRVEADGSLQLDSLETLGNFLNWREVETNLPHVLSIKRTFSVRDGVVVLDCNIEVERRAPAGEMAQRASFMWAMCSDTELHLQCKWTIFELYNFA